MSEGMVAAGMGREPASVSRPRAQVTGGAPVGWDCDRVRGSSELEHGPPLLPAAIRTTIPESMLQMFYCS